MNRPKLFHVGETVYWVLRLYDPTDGVTPIDADSTPTVAVRKNGSSVGDSVTVTKRSATTGIYDCSYNPSGEAEGDFYTLEETATISSTDYVQNWEIVCLAVERGTDSAALASGVNVTQIGGSTAPVTNIGVVYDTDFAANYNATLDAWNVNTTHAAGTAWASGAIVAGSFHAAAIAAIQSGLSTLTQAQVTGGAYALNNASFAFNAAVNTAIAAAVEAAILDEGDATPLLAAISAKVEEFLINEGDATATLAAIAAAVVAALGTGGGLTALATAAQATAIESDTQDIQSRLPAALTADGNIKADSLRISGSATAADNVEQVFATDFADVYNATDNHWHVDVQQVKGSATAAQNMTTVFATDFATNYDSTNDKWNTRADLQTIKGQTVTCAAGVTVYAHVGTSAASTAQTGDAYAYLGTNLGLLGANATEAGGTGDHLTAVAVASLATQAKADVNAEVDAAIETYHLDHLLAATYDPASKPGAADALLNELVESDAGVSRFTANALEQAPSGSGSDPWSIALPGAYSSGTAGHILGNRLDVAVSSISSSASPQLLQTTTIATLASQTSFTLTAGSADNDAYNLGSQCIAIITDQSTATQKAAVKVSDYVGSTKTITLASAPAFTIAVGDSVSIVAVGDDSQIVSLLSAAGVTVTAPVADDGNLTLYNGRRYDGTAHAKISFTVTKDYSAATSVVLIVHDKDDPTVKHLEAAAVVASASLITVSTTATFSPSLTFAGCPLVCELRYSLVAKWSSYTETIATDKAFVYDEPVPA